MSDQQHRSSIAAVASPTTKQSILQNQRRQIAQSLKGVSVVAGGVAQVQALSEGMLIIDSSGSMGDGSKMGDAIKAAIGFAEDKAMRDPKGSLAVIGFDHEIIRAIDFTLAKEVDRIKAAVSTLSARGGTNMPNAIDFAASQFSARTDGKPRFVVILTDGYSEGDPVAAARQLKSAGIDVFAVGFGRSPSDVDSRLPQVADPGRYFFCSDLASLLAQFKAISKQTSVPATGQRQTQP